MNRPAVLNALSKNLLRLLYAALERAESDDDVKVVILTGSGRSFSAGGDLYAAAYPDPAPAPSALEIQLKIWAFGKPVIAAVRGHAFGQACELAGICDMTIAAEDARFGEVQIRHGFGPPVLITPFLVGIKNAKEIMLLGEAIDAREAQRMGLVNRVVATEDLDTAAEAIASKLAALPQGAVRLNKLLINRAYELAGFREALAYHDDPAIAALSNRSRDDEVSRERLKLLTERGWGAFKEARDQGYRDGPKTND